MDEKPFVFRFGEFAVAERELRVTRAGETLAVEPKALRVLLYLLHNSGRLVTKEEILDAIWPDVNVGENSLTRAIALLRKVLDDDTREPRYIGTVPGSGYRFIGHVESNQPEPAEPVPANPVAPIARPRGLAMHKTLMLALAMCATATVALLVWYLRRPPIPPRITDYTQITHDGRRKVLVGTDGTRLFFNRIFPFSVEQIAITGGESAPIPMNLPDPLLTGVSPDGSAFLVMSFSAGRISNPVWTVNLPGNSLRPLADAVSATWSPDGNSVAYSTANGDIYIAGSKGDARKIASVGAIADTLSWSHDGKVLRFSRDSVLWEISSAGTNLHQLLPGWRPSSWQCCGRWTPDGQLFIFLSGSPFVRLAPTLLGSPMLPGGQVWALQEKRVQIRGLKGEPIRLTSGPISWGAPIPAKDGKTVFANGLTMRGELVRLDTQSKQFQPFLDGISAEFVSFSRDGKSMVFVSYPEGILWRTNRDGSNRIQLSDPPMHPVNPRWSPDGAQILFWDANSAGKDELFTVSSHGGNLLPLLPDQPRLQGDSDWSPDGRRIVFDNGDVGGPGPKNTLCILDVSNHQVTTVPGSEGVYSPRWSPDGEWIVGLWFDSTSLKLFDVRSQTWSTLQTGEVLGWPAWSNDSRFVYFLETSAALMRIKVNGGPAEKIFDLKDFHTIGLYSDWLALDPNDAPLMLRDAGSQDIYALTLERK
jgi:DNA-binding winged helix-turn-helix (wHTH) protein/Tol biopolymer transport system component